MAWLREHLQAALSPVPFTPIRWADELCWVINTMHVLHRPVFDDIVMRLETMQAGQQEQSST
jgi:hypothetical protein